MYVNGPIGVARLAEEYGGKRDRGSKRYHAVAGSGSVARHCVRQLEAMGFIERYKNRGRVVTPKGRSLLDNTAEEVFKEEVKKHPELKKY